MPRSRNPSCGCSRTIADYFPVYQAVWVARSAFIEQHPREWQALKAGRRDQRAGHDRHECAGRHSAIWASPKLPRNSWDAEAPRSQSLARATSCSARASICGWSACRCCFRWLVGIPLGLIAVRFHAAGQAILIVERADSNRALAGAAVLFDSAVRRRHASRHWRRCACTACCRWCSTPSPAFAPSIPSIWKMRAPSA